MRQRSPAQSIIEVLLLEQQLLTPRSLIDRMIGRSPLGSDSLRCFDAARAEIVVGRALARLPSDWIVFHSLPVGDSGTDVDHLVIGPAGVFALRAERHARQSVQVVGRSVHVGARTIPHVREAEYEALGLTSLLARRMPMTAAVHGVVVLVDARRVTVQAQPDRVTVVAAVDLCALLLSLPPLLEPLDREEIAALVEDPELWHARPASDPPEILRRFNELLTEVARARRTRLIWWPLGLAGTVILLFDALAPSFPPLLGIH